MNTRKSKADRLEAAKRKNEQAKANLARAQATLAKSQQAIKILTDSEEAYKVRNHTKIVAGAIVIKELSRLESPLRDGLIALLQSNAPIKEPRLFDGIVNPKKRVAVSASATTEAPAQSAQGNPSSVEPSSRDSGIPSQKTAEEYVRSVRSGKYYSLSEILVQHGGEVLKQCLADGTLVQIPEQEYLKHMCSPLKG
ncbi:MAG: hypothetical protein LBN33_06410 [Desulfovibrio sp.]|jgi:hypothetical protein|nr:hypothetical protein [Desulfovibrio sp.]